MQPSLKRGKKVRRHLGRLVGTAWRAPLTANETFGLQVCPQLLPGDFAAAPCFHFSEKSLLSAKSEEKSAAAIQPNGSPDL